VPFTGIIEMTNLISQQETNKRHLVYLPKYTAPDDPLFDASEGEIWDSFQQSLKRIFPNLESSDVENRFLFRERFVQPVPVLQYSAIVPPMQTRIPGLILANTTQIINSTLNNNEMVKIARRAVDLVFEHTQNASGARRYSADSSLCSRV
jgi:protoporphyrinogen oxidase